MSSALRTLPIALALASLAAAPDARAVEPLDTVNIRVAGYLNRFDTELRADGDTSRGTPIDLRRDLGLDDDKTIAYLGASWRPFEHHEFGLGYYRNDLSKTRQLQRDIVFDDTVYSTSATVRSEYDVETYELNYTWWAASRDNWALGPRVGLVWYKITLGIDLQLDAGGNQGGAGGSEEVSADLPAPSIGAGWRWTPAEQWRLFADAGYFSADVNDVDADVSFLRGGVEWYPWERFGFSLDYTANRIQADARTNRFDGNLDFRDEGLRFGLSYRF